MLRDEIAKFEELTGASADNYSISYVGGYMDGYAKSKESGRWIPRLHASENDIFICSNCKQETGREFPFCPFCGAKMAPYVDPYENNSNLPFEL